MDNKSFLGTEPVFKLMYKLSIPTIIAQLVNMFYNIVDRIYIGHMPYNGSLALTGVGVSMPIIVIITAFAAFVCSGGAPIASIYMGKGDNDYSEKILGNCFILQIIISIILTIIILIFNKPFLLMFGASKNTINFACDYMNIYALGTVFVELTLGLNAFITAQGFSKYSMITVLIGAFINIILDPIFIYIFNMGVKGAALATVISQAISCIWVISFLKSKKTILKLKKENFVFDKKIVKSCFALGISTFVMQSSESILSICFNSSLLKVGGDVAVGAMTVLSSVMMFAMLPLQGLAQGMQPITSYNYGAKNRKRVIESFKLLLIASFIYSTVLWICIMLFPEGFVKIFSKDNILIAFTAKALRIYFFALLVFGIQIACQMTFVSIGNALSSVIIAVLRKFILLIPLIYILPMFIQNKTNAIYMAEPIADTLSVIFTIILFSIEFKKSLKNM